MRSFIMVKTLIADDSSPIGLVLKEILEIADHVVAEATDDAEAVDFFQKHRPELLMTDLAIFLIIVITMSYYSSFKIFTMLRFSDKKIARYFCNSPIR